MTLEELLSHGTSSIEDMEKYFKTVGLNHVKREDLDRIIGKFGLVVFKLNSSGLFWFLSFALNSSIFIR